MSKANKKSSNFTFNKKMVIIVIIPVILLAGLIAITSQSLNPSYLVL